MNRFEGDTVAIDLGMTNSLIAYMDKIAEMSVCCVNAEGHSITPSVIHFETAQNPIVGEVAKECSVLAPDRTISNYKRAIGKNKVLLEVDGQTFTAEKLAELQMHALLKDAEAFLEQKCKSAVITVPITADQRFMNAVMEAGKAAGLEKVHLVNEVIASVSHYDEVEMLDGMTICVFDLGGGTLDIAVATISSEMIDVRIVLGEKELGGADWDSALLTFVKENYLHGRKMNAEDVQKLVLDVERAKKILSKKNQTRFILNTSEDKESITITREMFESCTKQLLERVESKLQELQSEMAEKGITQLDKIYMVGGSTKMPQIKELVEHMFPKTAIVSKNPDEAVALGAAVYAKRISETQKEIAVKHSYKENKKKLQTVSARSYGIAVQRGEEGEKKILNVIPQGTELPVTVERAFYTKEKNQKEVSMKIYETMSKEEFSDIQQEALLGMGYLEVGKNLPKHSKVCMKFSMGVDGILTIEGMEEQGNTKARLVLEGCVA